jgi:hypothetical protein
MKEDHVAQQKSQQRGRPIYAPTKGSQLVGESLNAQGNEYALRTREKGREFVAVDGADRPAGSSTARMASGVHPLDSVTGTYMPRA